MPIDPNIPLQAGNLWNPAQNLSSNLAVAGQVQNYQAAKAAFEAKKQEQRDNEAFKAVAAEANGDVPTMIQKARAAGLNNHAGALEKHWMEIQEGMAKLDDNQRKQEAIKADRIAKKALWATTPDRWASDPELAATPFDQRNALLFGSMTAQQVLELQRKQADEANAQKFEREKFGETMRHNRAMEAKPTGGESGSKPPAGYRWNGPNLEPIPGGPADPRTAGAKPMSEAQANALGFGVRALEAQEILNAIESSGKNVTNPLMKFAGSIPGGQYAIPEHLQKYNQAKENFITAVLRKESGAAISAGEFKAEDQKYFPQPGDSPGVIAQKARARQTAIKVLETSAGRPLTTVDTGTPIQPAQPKGPTGAMSLDAYLKSQGF